MIEGGQETEAIEKIRWEENKIVVAKIMRTRTKKRADEMKRI